MDDLIKFIDKYKNRIVPVTACLMFIFFAVSAIDIAGKAQAGGLKVLFNGRGLGFSRFLSGILLIIPILIILDKFVNLKSGDKIKEHFDSICFAAGFIICILLAIALPQHITLAWGSWLYILLSLCGVCVSSIGYIKR